MAKAFHFLATPFQKGCTPVLTRESNNPLRLDSDSSACSDRERNSGHSEVESGASEMIEYPEMVKVRLQRHGRHKLPFYRIVVCDERCRRDGRFIEILGTYNPMRNPPEVKLDEQRVIKWIRHGAQPSHSVRRLIEMKMPGFLGQLEEQRRAKIQQRRRKRKERLSMLKSQTVASA